MSGKKVTITYCDDYDVWPFVATDLSSRLPLKNLKWHSSSQRTERHIPSLEVDLQRFNFDQGPTPLLATHSTYLNLYFVSCDDNEVYKNRVRRQIKTWVDLSAAKKNQEWLIVYVAGQDARRSNNYLGLKTSVYDKIRADFSQGKRDKCTYIRIHDPEGAQSELWAAFIEKVKESILLSFDMQVNQIQEDTRRLDMQRHMPGWNYCTFFILKEGLAQAFEIMTLYEDALIQYDELEASFFQVLKDKALAWFGHFGGDDTGDDSGNILDFKRKDYRDLINKNVISVFDFRCYLFARQSRMLIKLQRVVEACSRAQLFISSFIPSIRENKGPASVGFVESWVFSACMNVINECETLSAQLAASDANFLVAFNAVKADLLLTARRQLDKLGVYYGHLPVSSPFSIYLDSVHEHKPDVKPSDNMTHQKLLEGIDSVEAFDKMYMALSTRAIKSYDACYRPRAALTVHGDIAALKYTRGKLEEAVRIFDSVIWRYEEQDWGSIENSLLEKCADAQKRLGRIDQYVTSLLALLKNTSGLTSESASTYTQELLENVRRLDQDVRRPFSPMFSIAVVAILDDEKTVESTSVEICIDNHLPKALDFDRLSLRLVGNDPEQVWFAVESQTLQPGKNRFRLTSKISTSGNYVVEACELTIGKLVFGHNFMRDSQKKRVVRLNHNPQQLHATVTQPDEICLGETQRFAIKVTAGKRPISGGRVRLEPQSEGLEMVHAKTLAGQYSLDKDEKKPVDITVSETGEMELPALEAGQTLEIFAGYIGSYTEFEYRIKVIVAYTSEGTEHEFISADFVHVTVPLVVTESCIFREDCVLLKVDLSCNGDQPVRILESSLQPSKVYAVENPSEVEQWNLTIFPKQVSTFVYKLLKRTDLDSTQDLPPKVRFLVKYRTLKNEVESSLANMLENKLREKNNAQHFDYVFSKVREAFLSSVDYVSYGLTDVVHLDDFDAELCESFLLNRDLRTKVELLDLIEEFFEQNEAITMQTVLDNAPYRPTSMISFPLDVPSTKVVHTVDLVLNVNKEFLLSESCACTLRIKQSSYWSATEAECAASQEFYYDIDIDYENWLLSGKRRLRFKIQPDETLEFPVHLVPLRTGNLLLPPIRVLSTSINTSVATVYTNSAQQILVQAKSKAATFFVEQQQRFLQPQPYSADVAAS